MKYFLAFAICFAFSCKKNKDTSCETCASGNKKDIAVVINSGPLASDGCGWLIQVLPDSVYYHPDLLDTSFQHNNLPVNINYQLTSDVFVCGLAASQIQVIHVNSITRR